MVPPQDGIREGDVAPNFNLPERDGKILKLSDFRSQTVLLNFWATGCPPCVLEMPSLDRLGRIMGQDDFKVLAISIDYEGWPRINEFLKKVPLSFPILLDKSADVAALYGTFVLPESYLIGPDGIVIKKYHGPREWDKKSMVAEIRAFMSESKVLGE